jgi:hypothetical protein
MVYYGLLFKVTGLEAHWAYEEILYLIFIFSERQKKINKNKIFPITDK